MKYRKKPVVIEAVQWTGKNLKEIMTFLESEFSYAEQQSYYTNKFNYDLKDLYITTPEGKVKASEGDYIVKGVNGEYYPCKPDIFKKTHQEVELDIKLEDFDVREVKSAEYCKENKTIIFTLINDEKVAISIKDLLSNIEPKKSKDKKFEITIDKSMGKHHNPHYSDHLTRYIETNYDRWLHWERYIRKIKNLETGKELLITEAEFKNKDFLIRKVMSFEVAE